MVSFVRQAKAMQAALIVATILLSSTASAENDKGLPAVDNDEVCLLQVMGHVVKKAAQGNSALETSKELQQPHQQTLQEVLAAYETPQAPSLVQEQSQVAPPAKFFARPPMSLLGISWDSIQSEPTAAALLQGAAPPKVQIETDLSQLMSLQEQLKGKLQGMATTEAAQQEAQQATQEAAQKAAQQAMQAAQAAQLAAQQAAQQVTLHAAPVAAPLAPQTNLRSNVNANAIVETAKTDPQPVQVITQPTVIGDNLGSSWQKIAPYILFIGEAIILLCCCGCAGAGYIADYKEDDDIELPWYCDICTSMSQCCIGVFKKPQMLFCLLVYVLLINIMWSMCVKDAFEKFALRLSLYFFAVLLALGLLFMFFAAVQKQIRDSWMGDLYRNLSHICDDVAMLTLFTQKRFGKQFYATMKDSNQFTEDQLRGTKTAMRNSGTYTADKIDDVTDFFGITEVSSDDDITLANLIDDAKLRLKKGKMSKAQYAKLYQQNHERHHQNVKKKEKKDKTLKERAAEAAKTGWMGSKKDKKDDADDSKGGGCMPSCTRGSGD